MRRLTPISTHPLAALILLSFALAPAAFPAEIVGQVTDASGAVIAGARITAINLETGELRQTSSNQYGYFRLPLLSPGRYRIDAEEEGFQSVVRTGLELLANSVVRSDFVLPVGPVMETVVVEHGAPLLETETSDRKVSLDSNLVSQAPLIGRSWFELTALAPGVNPGKSPGPKPNQEASGQNVGVNGSTSFTANWLINGGVGTFPVSQNPGFLKPPLEAIAEVNLVTSNFSAESGNGVAVFNVITKSGTNEFHGSAYEFVRNDKLNARNFFEPERSPFRWNQFGGTIGGPIQRDKTFFFFAFQQEEIRDPSNQFFTFPTEAMRQGDFSAPGLPVVHDPDSLAEVNGEFIRTPFPNNQVPLSRMDPVALNIQEQLPLPNRPGLANNLFFTASSPTSFQTWNVKGDHNLSDAHRLSGSYLRVERPFFRETPTCPMDCRENSQTEQSAQITHVWTANPTTLNEFRSSFIRTLGLNSSPNHGQGWPERLGLPNAVVDAFPTINVSGTVPTSISGGLRAKIAFNSFVQSNTTTLIRGRHTIKFGGEFNKWQQNLAWNDFRSGNFNFSGIFTRNPADAASSGLGFADFLFGLPQTWSVNNSPMMGARVSNLQLFLQDDYKMKPNLTLNLGVRYQLQTGWTEVADRVATFDPELTNPATGTPGALWFAPRNGRDALQDTIPAFVSPRIGLAWQPAEGWSIRAGYGIFTLMWGGNSYTSGLGIGQQVRGFETSTDLVTPIFRLSEGAPDPILPSPDNLTPDLLNGQGVSFFPYDTPMAYMQQWQFSIQRELPGEAVVEAAYVGSRSIHLGAGRDFNQVPEALLGPGDAQPRRPFPQFQNINASFFDGGSSYHSLQLGFKKKFASGWMLQTNYTFSKTLDTGTGSGWGGLTSIDTLQDARDLSQNYGPSSVDSPHVWNGAFIYQLPFGKGRRHWDHGGLVDALFGGWQVSGMWHFHAGVPFTPVMGTANLSGALSGAWRPDRVARGELSNPAPERYFDTTAFVSPEPYTFGDSGRNILRGPDVLNLYLSLAKTFRLGWLGEQGALQVKADAENVLNRTNFGMPDANIGTAAAGTVNSALPAREIQLGVKVSF